MIKLFYHPETLEIKGMSVSEHAFEFPFIEIEKPILFFENYKIEIKDDIPTLVLVKGSYTDEEWDKIINE